MTGMVRKAGNLLFWEIIVSKFEMDENCNYLDPRKTVRILKKNF